ncbi:MAG: hypothetical protein P8Z79_16400 [Sedimentisphaerales bacterium]
MAGPAGTDPNGDQSTHRKASGGTVLIASGYCDVPAGHGNAYMGWRRLGGGGVRFAGPMR